MANSASDDKTLATATLRIQSSQKSARRRKAILKAAAKLFRNGGYSATTMRRIADAAGIEAGSIYYYFKSKNEIMEEILDVSMREMYQEAKCILDKQYSNNQKFPKLFELLVSNHLWHLLQGSNFTSANIRNYYLLSIDERAAHKALRDKYVKLWTAFLTRAQQEGEICKSISLVLLRQFILGTINWTVEWYNVERYPVDRLAVRLSRLILEGMCVKEVCRPALAVMVSTELSFVGISGGKADQTRDKILRAAARVFRESGYSVATMRRIAAEAGLEAGSVYYHFPSKEAVVDEVLDRGLRDLLNDTKNAVDAAEDSNKKNRLSIAIAAHIRNIFLKNEFTSANIRIYSLLPEEIRARHRPIRRIYASFWDQLLNEAQAAGVLRSDIKIMPLRQAILGGLNWTIEWFDPTESNNNDRYSLEEFTEFLINILFYGIKPNTEF